MLQTCEVKPPGGRRGGWAAAGDWSNPSRRAGCGGPVQNAPWKSESAQVAGALIKLFSFSARLSGGSGRARRAVNQSRRASAWSHAGHMFRSYVPLPRFNNCIRKMSSRFQAKRLKKTELVYFHSFIIHFFIPSIESKKHLSWVLNTALRNMPLFTRFLSFSLLST